MSCVETWSLSAARLLWRYQTLFFNPRRSSDKESTSLTSALGKEIPFLATALVPVLTSTPAAAQLSSGTPAGDSTSQKAVRTRKRRRLAASPGGLHWNSAGEKRRLTANHSSSHILCASQDGSASRVTDTSMSTAAVRHIMVAYTTLAPPPPCSHS